MKTVNFITIILMLCVLITLTACADAGQPQSADISKEAQTVQPGSAGSPEPADSQGTPAAQIIEPEQLISKADAEALLGMPVKDGEKTDNAVVGQKICFYDTEDEDSFAFLQISITQQAFMPEGSPSTPESIYTVTKDAFADDLTPVEGLGDEAFLATGGYYILCDGYFLTVFAGNIDKPETIAILDAAGALAVTHLKALIGA